MTKHCWYNPRLDEVEMPSLTPLVFLLLADSDHRDTSLKRPAVHLGDKRVDHAEHCRDGMTALSTKFGFTSVKLHAAQLSCPELDFKTMHIFLWLKVTLRSKPELSQLLVLKSAYFLGVIF